MSTPTKANPESRVGGGDFRAGTSTGTGSWSGAGASARRRTSIVTAAVPSLSTSRPWDQSSRVRRTLDALADGRHGVLITTGPFTVGSTPDPAGASLAPYVPHHVVLPEASVVITHAGHGTVTAALSHGVPMVCLPNLRPTSPRWPAGSPNSAPGSSSTATPRHRPPPRRGDQARTRNGRNRVAAHGSPGRAVRQRENGLLGRDSRLLVPRARPTDCPSASRWCTAAQPARDSWTPMRWNVGRSVS
ncbi:glycosyltransferase [Actinomadura sp. 3N407]|uniref:glycosyltransferase n=1 Tax=Actinomadura sp. 3N407 TaxID=3457423 RepID=UPI003FCD5F41